MRPFTSTISLDEARRRLDANVRPIERIERVRLDEAAGRVAAADVASPIDVPPFARSAMDGYAVVAADTEGASRDAPVRLRQLDRIFTGPVSTQVVTRGTCAEIATGAPLPAGADAVVMVEESAKADAGTIDIFAAAAAGQNIGKRGADIQAGDRVIASGDLVTPGRVGALAAIGRADVEVFAKPRVAILSTGNEVVEPGETLQDGHIYDVNRFTLGAIVAAHGGVPERQRAAQDTVEALLRALDECATADLIVFSGGSSVGDRDLVVDAIAARGRSPPPSRSSEPHRFSACPATPRRVCRTRTSCWCRSCARSPVCRLTRRTPCACRSAGASCPPQTGTSSTPSASATAPRTRRSKARAISPACQWPTATSRSLPTRAPWKKART